MKTSRRRVRCTMCTPHRWKGNARDRLRPKDSDAVRRLDREARDGAKRERPRPH